jgi:hypothetical protein
MFHMQRCMKVIVFIEIQCETLRNGTKFSAGGKLACKKRLNMCFELNVVPVRIEIYPELCEVWCFSFACYFILYRSTIFLGGGGE